MAHTLNSLAVAMRGMPREARVLIKLPDGNLVACALAGGSYVSTRAGRIAAPPSALNNAEYAIILYADDTPAHGQDEVPDPDAPRLPGI